MAEVRVDPGDLDDFAKYVRQIAEDWEEKKGAPAKLVQAPMNHKESDGEHLYPFTGSFSDTESLIQAYDAKLGEIGPAFEALYKMLLGLAEASKKIADDYRDTAALNKANVDAIESTLTQELGKAAAPSEKKE